MSKIYILPENIAAKIAAGEVIQRPESVVKELLENSIDAGAENITLIIKNAGKSLIQVIDDGSGMSSEDAVLALKRHSTSKIKTIEDLDRLNTFGFRGEALYSIASVAKLEIKTRLADEELGTFIVSEDGKIIEQSSIKCEKGTNIAVKNLFFNIPVRRKFLKSNASEFKHIYDTWLRTVLSNPNIRFRFIDDEKEIYDLPSQSLEKRIALLYSESLFNNLIQVNETIDEISVYGYIGSPDIVKKSKNDQFIFLNNRYIINKSISAAIFRAYEFLIEKGDYPFILLFINLDPSRIDVNVHPSKLEVKFDDEQKVYGIIHNIVKRTLGAFDFTPKISLGSENTDFNKIRLSSDRSGDTEIIQKNKISDLFSFSKNADGIKNDTKFNINDSFSSELLNSFYDTKSTEIEDTIPKRIVWQLHNKYILTPIKNGLMIIDQHVAHERILYERTLKCFEADLPLSQQLLFPETIEFSPPDFNLIIELKELLKKIGFDFKISGKNSIVLNGVPQEVKLGKEKTTILEILEAFREYSNILVREDKDNLAKSYACKTAIKAGDVLSESEMLSLIDNLFACNVTNVCPHGRPIILKLTLDELDRRFGRTVEKSDSLEE